jgi:ribosome assembly protein YihI (activator of Der GTPase)
MKMRQKNNQPIIMMPKRMFHLNNMLRCEINMDLLISEVEKYKVQMPQSAVNEKLYSGVVQNENKLGTEALQEILIEMKNNKETLYVTDQRQIDKRFGRIKTFFIRIQ